MRDNRPIEGLRVILFLFIFLFHAWGQAFPLGWAGIDTFLVITAFFLTRKYLKTDKQSIKVIDVMQKRAKRLYPAYITVLLGMTVLFVAMNHQLPGDFFSYFLFAQNFQWLYVPEVTRVPGIGHFWYLTLDFYLVLTWVLVFKYVPRRWWKITFVTLFLSSVVYRSVSAYHGVSSSYMLPWGMMDMFAAGGLLAMVLDENSKTGLPWLAFIVGIAVFVLCTNVIAKRFDCSFLEAFDYYRTSSGYADHPITVQIHLTLALLSLFVVWFFTAYGQRSKVLSNIMLCKWGGVTYELYVFHFPILWGLRHFTNNHLIIIMVGLVATILVTIIWKRIVESHVVKMLFLYNLDGNRNH